MAMQRRTRARAAVPAVDAGMLSTLDESALEKLLLTAKTSKVLGRLASSSRQLCSFARSRVPVRLSVYSKKHAQLVIQSHTCGRPPFSGCTHLSVSANDLAQGFLAVGVLNAAQQWTGLQQLELSLLGDGTTRHLRDGLPSEDPATLEYCASVLLSAVPSMQQLRRLVLESPALGSCCVRHIQQLTQITYLSLTNSRTPVHAAADLTGLSRLTSLKHLRLNWALAPHLPAGPQGPYCLPSSLVTLELCSRNLSSPAPMAGWVAYLCACPQLQQLWLHYGAGQQHPSVHPVNLVPLLAQHHPQLRNLSMSCWSSTTWDAAVAGLPAAAVPVPAHWQPDASLAALTGLRRLSGLLCIREQADWQHLAPMTALTCLGRVTISSVLELQAGSTLALLELGCTVALGGYGVGCVLLACPLLKVANIQVTAVAAPVAAGARLQPHPALQELHLSGCEQWGGPSAAAAQFAELAPVLSGVRLLSIAEWAPGSCREALIVPDLSPCTALTSLAFVGRDQLHRREMPVAQESILSMVAPLKQLRRLEVTNAQRVTAHIALGLQSILPHLQHIQLKDCGSLLYFPDSRVRDTADDPWDSETEVVDPQEDQALQQVLRLLRPGLKLVVSGYWPE